MARFPDPAVRYAPPAFTSNAELQAQLRELVREAKAAGSRAQLLVAGVSQTGQPIEALLLSRQADLDPAALRASGRTTVLLIGEQHGDGGRMHEIGLAAGAELAGMHRPAIVVRLGDQRAIRLRIVGADHVRQGLHGNDSSPPRLDRGGIWLGGECPAQFSPWASMSARSSRSSDMSSSTGASLPTSRVMTSSSGSSTSIWRWKLSMAESRS